MNYLLGREGGEKRTDYALLLALIVVAAAAIVFVVGPQVALVYAQAGSAGGG